MNPSDLYRPAAPKPQRRKPLWRRILRRGPWENVATTLIGAGVVMLMQPFSLWLYGWSFGVILTGTVAFMIVSKFPER